MSMKSSMSPISCYSTCLRVGMCNGVRSLHFDTFSDRRLTKPAVFLLTVQEILIYLRLYQ